ncbi:hypothetical protein E2C01_026680 [Portunus trituberculatus]|uniref:Uncharacterized protein n=1 Tax=Portunus trituberculatus TaxID=210409 RepID=A0A5B7ELM9_PORTR|nr:hypothetical protein [Portunus trituberculatus]
MEVATLAVARGWLPQRLKCDKVRRVNGSLFSSDFLPPRDYYILYFSQLYITLKQEPHLRGSDARIILSQKGSTGHVHGSVFRHHRQGNCDILHHASGTVQEAQARHTFVREYYIIITINYVDSLQKETAGHQ